MGKKYPSISIAIPAYNEEESIIFVVNDCFKKLPIYFNKNFEVIVVDDGSRDQTGPILDKLAQKYPKLRIIHQPNGGFSKAMLTGIMAAKNEYVAYLPADGQFLVDDMRHCFEVMSKNDLVLGYRGGRPDYSTKRMFLSYGYLLLVLMLFDFKFIDVGWVNIWKTKEVQKLKLKGSEGIFILIDIMVRFKERGLKIAEAPSYYRVRRAGEVKNTKFKVIRNTFISAVALWYKVKTNKL